MVSSVSSVLTGATAPGLFNIGTGTDSDSSTTASALSSLPPPTVLQPNNVNLDAVNIANSFVPPGDMGLLSNLSTNTLILTQAVQNPVSTQPRDPSPVRVSFGISDFLDSKSKSASTFSSALPSPFDFNKAENAFAKAKSAGNDINDIFDEKNTRSRKERLNVLA